MRQSLALGLAGVFLSGFGVGVSVTPTGAQDALQGPYGIPPVAGSPAVAAASSAAPTAPGIEGEIRVWGNYLFIYDNHAWKKAALITSSDTNP